MVSKMTPPIFRKAYLGTSRMSQIIRPIDLESQVIKGMDHFMSHCVFEMSLVFHFICAKQNPIFGVEATTLSVCTATAVDIVVV
jgi:hypothetical protein